MLLFGLKNRIPAILYASHQKEKRNDEKINPEHALILLKEKFELGMISEEDYQAQRVDIINKL